MTQKNDENTICDHKNKRTIVLNYEKKSLTLSIKECS
jgi:hypothetical protein